MSKILVHIIESEAGWGQRIDERREFDTVEQAEAFVTQFNEPNNEARVPSWYMYARVVSIGGREVL